MPKEVVAAEQVNENNLKKFFAEKPRELHEIEGRKVYGSLWKTAVPEEIKHRITI